jgi:C1A family cysteine protease
LIRFTFKPFFKQNGICRYNKSSIAGNATKFVNLPKNNEYEITKTVALIGPVAAGIDASQKDFQFYSSGIYYSAVCSKDDLNHAVAIVGYDVNATTGQEYYIIKNSWGIKW